MSVLFTVATIIFVLCMILFFVSKYLPDEKDLKK